MAAAKKNRKITASEATSKLIQTILKMPAEKIIKLLNDVEEKQYLNKREPRVPYSAEVNFSVNDRFYSGYISNINGNGIFIETEAEFNPGEKLTLSFEAPGSEKYIKITGEIVRSNEEGIGISFDVNIQEILKSSSEEYGGIVFSSDDATDKDDDKKDNDDGMIKFF